MNMSWIHFSLNLFKKARTNFKEFWSGNPWLPYQGWFGKLAKHQPGVAVTLFCSINLNVAWLMFSIEFNWLNFSAIGWIFGGVAILWAAAFILGMISDAGLWLLDNLQSGRMDEPGKG